MTITYADQIAKLLGLRPTQTAAAIELFDAGNTVPFIARYRKEATGTLDEEQLRQIQSSLDRLRAIDERRAAILASIEEQGKLTPELSAAINTADSLTALEDLYAPYKPKRRTRASIAREKGLQGLADLILTQARTPYGVDEAARPFINEQVESIEEALAGARDIVAETISEHADVRRLVRLKATQWGILRCEKVADADDPKQVYAVYYEFEGKVDRLRPHQVLAINRGEKEKILNPRLLVTERDWEEGVLAVFRPDQRSPFCDQLQLAIADSAERLLLPAIERDIRRALTETAETHAIFVFASNLRALLLQPPLSGRTVLGIDPGFRTGCKVAVVNPTGKLIATATIYPHEPQKQWDAALATLRDMVTKLNVTLITIGNGTASRESEQLAAQLIKDLPDVRYLIVNEAGASVYSASPLARAEFPQLDVSLRGAVSIARRAQDPLAELVKIEPKAIGVGLYQHDVDQARLGQTLDGVVEDAVNRVGVDVNTASAALLTHVAGIGPKLAEKIVAHRDENGSFDSREDLREVPGLGPKAYEQCAGFCRIRGGSEPLDATAIHPESYPAARALLKQTGIQLSSPTEERRAGIEALRKAHSLDELASSLNCGLPTLMDILDQLLRPGRDPRADAPAPILRTDVLKMEDLSVGMRLKGTVRNVVDFGAFVDVGVKQDGLLHRSQMPPGTVLQVGDVIDVEVIKVEVDRGRISLSYKN
jgi:uncharacterized protein